MPDLQEIEKLLASLTRAEKAQLLQWIVRDLGDAFPGVESTPGVCGGDPCIVRTRISVWVVENYRRLGATDAEILRMYPTLCAEDLVNAWAYVRAHRGEIEQQIRENEAAQPEHAGIIACLQDLDFAGLTDRIHNAITTQPELSNRLLHIYRPQQYRRSNILDLK